MEDIFKKMVNLNYFKAREQERSLKRAKKQNHSKLQETETFFFQKSNVVW